MEEWIFYNDLLFQNVPQLVMSIELGCCNRSANCLLVNKIVTTGPTQDSEDQNGQLKKVTSFENLMSTYLPPK